MVERPILFSAPMVRAVLAGTKTQTRRVLKAPRGIEFDGTEQIARRSGDDGGFCAWFSEYPDEGAFGIDCPYGQPGDRLWVRETWQAELRWDWTAPRDITPDSPIYFEFGDEAVPACAGKKRPSIHMPRWASRITLEITGVRVERLQAISEADAQAEGCTQNHNGYFWGGPHAEYGRKQMPTAKAAFADLWESINGPGSWDLNPWVWVVELKRAAQAGAERGHA